MKANTIEINDLIGKEITKIFFLEGRLIIATTDNFAIFHGYDDNISEGLDYISLPYMAAYNYIMNPFVSAGVITQEEVDIFIQKKKEEDEIIKKNMQQAKIQRDLAERDRLNKLYPQ